MALTKVTGQVINSTTDLSVGVATVGGGTSTGDLYVVGVSTLVGDLTLNGNVTIGGTLTYEDVTNVDSVGLITARKGITVLGAGVTIAAGGLNVNAGIATFNDHVQIISDNKRLKFGAGDDLNLYSTGTNGWVYTPQSGADLYMGTNAGEVYIQTGTSGNDTAIKVNSGGAVELNYSTNKKLNTRTDGIDITGKLYPTGNIHMPDSIGIKLGAGDDLNIWHYQTDNKSYLSLVNTSTLKIHNTTDDETMAQFIPNGAVELYYDGTKRFETNSTGAKFVGNLYADDNSELRLGDSGDLQFFHNSTSGEGRIYNSNAAGLVLISNLIKLKNQANNETMLQATNGGAVELYYDNTLRVSTASAGVNINLTSTDTAGTPDKYLNLYNDENAANTMAGLRFMASTGANDHWIYQKKHAAGSGTDLIVAHGSTERLRFIESGGFTFNGDTAAANALDDYEEGTWTPNPHDGSCTVTFAKYRKVGGTVTLWARVSGFSDTSTNDMIRIKGLPFSTSSSWAGVGGACMAQEVSESLGWVAFPEDDQIRFYATSTGSFAQLRHNELDSGHEIYFVSTYPVG